MSVSHSFRRPEYVEPSTRFLILGEIVRLYEVYLTCHTSSKDIFL